MQITNSNSSAPFGFCACGAENTGSYYGGSPGCCQECFDKSLEEVKQRDLIQAQKNVIEQAREAMEIHGITLTEALLLINKL